MNWTENQIQQYASSVKSYTNTSSIIEGDDVGMFIPPIPLPWYRAAMEATKGRGAATIAVIWLESKLQSRNSFTIRKSITDKLGLSKKARQTMVEHLRMMCQVGLIELTTVGKKYPQVSILKLKTDGSRN